MIFYWINRIITGDTLFHIAIWISCIISYSIARMAKRWSPLAKFVYFVIMSFALSVYAHYLIDKLQIFWVTPLNEPMFIER